MSESEALETTRCRSRSSSAEVHALRLFIRLVAMSSDHARFRALDAAGLSFFASALAERLPLIGRSISFVPLRPCVASYPSLVQPRGRYDAAFQGIHRVDYVFALWPRLRSNRLAVSLLIDQFGQRNFVMILKFFGLECFPPTSKRPCLCPCRCCSPN
jgi:hypothetical protein